MKHTVRGISIAAAMLLAACGSSAEYPAEGEAIAPEAELEVEMNWTRSADGLYPLTVQVEELPWPSEMGESVRAYAAWAVEGDADPRFLGVLRYDRDARFGEVDAATPEDRLTVFVTAEETEQPSAPSDLVIARREIVHAPR